MSAGLHTFVKRLRGAARGDALTTATDVELLTHFAADRDDLAFAELVSRHAPAVYAQCRRHLSDPGDLDDAFQATFVVLARKAGTLARPEWLCSWLCGVADRVARKARGRNVKRNTAERPLEAAEEPVTSDPTSDADLRAVLDQELDALPPDLRQLVVLCDVDGLSRRAAAKRLGIPVGTLSNRLTRARALLGSRLLRRGVALGAGLTLTSVSTATVPARLVSLTVSRITTNVVPPELIALACEGLPAMSTSRIVMILVVGVVTIGLTALGMTAGKPQPPAQANQLAARPPEEPPFDPDIPDHPEMIEGGTVLAADYSPDGKLFAVTATETRGWHKVGDTRVTLFDASTWKVLHHLTGPTAHARGLTFSADGKTLYVACDDGAVYAWDTVTGTAGEKLDAKAGTSNQVIRSPDGKLLVTTHRGGNDRKLKDSVRVWDAAIGQLVHTFESESYLSGQSAAFSPDGKRLAAAFSRHDGETTGIDGIVEWDVASGEQVNHIKTDWATPGRMTGVQRLAYTRDGEQLIAAGHEGWLVKNEDGKVMGGRCTGCLWVIDRATGEVVNTLVDRVGSNGVSAISLSADGKKLYALACRAGRNRSGWQFERNMLMRWDTATWELDWAKPGEATGWTTSLPIGPTGGPIGVGQFGGFVLADPTTGEFIGRLVRTPTW